jgi:hypothetical protein
MPISWAKKIAGSGTNSADRKERTDMRIASALFVAALMTAIQIAATGASAAPQVLGLVAMNQPIVMRCDETGCRAELSSFCLQQPRDNPMPETAYTPAEGADIALIGTRADGSTVHLNAADYMTFESSRGFTSVRASLDPAIATSLGLVSVAIEVGSEVSMLPDDVAGDPEPQSDAELALATGTYRAKAVEFFDAPGEQADAIRVTNSMINVLPEKGRTPSDSDGHLLAEVLNDDIAPTIDPGAIRQATKIHETCRQKVDVTHHIDTMRACLIGSHDRMVVNSNIEFWESLGGS